MENVYFEDIHKAQKAYPYIEPDNVNLSYVVHVHDELEIAFVRSGETTVIGENFMKRALSGDICVFMPGELHGFVSKADNRIFIMKAKIAESDSSHGFTSLSSVRLNKNIITAKDAVYVKLLSAIENIQKEHEQKSTGFEYAVNSIVYAVCADIVREIGFKRITTKQSEFISESMKLLGLVEKYTAENYTHAVSLEQVSDYCNFSKYYFSHVFKKITGMTFFSYLTAYRLDRAKELIIKTDMNMTDISYHCGFGTPRSFNRLFRKHYGFSPTEYAKSACSPKKNNSAKT